ncbi:MAG: hypothetical protein P1U42_12400 [Phycisphaerales bacterium]|nr:hypothetical protein [Phycisphaerales bacterium]
MSKIGTQLNASMGQTLQGQVGDVGWDTMVHSMRGAIEDQSHVIILGITLGVLVFVWVNYRLAKWLLKRLDLTSGVSKL